MAALITQALLIQLFLAGRLHKYDVCMKNCRPTLNSASGKLMGIFEAITNQQESSQRIHLPCTCSSFCVVYGKLVKNLDFNNNLCGTCWRCKSQVSPTPSTLETSLEKTTKHAETHISKEELENLRKIVIDLVPNEIKDPNVKCCWCPDDSRDVCCQPDICALTPRTAKQETSDLCTWCNDKMEEICCKEIRYEQLFQNEL